MVIPVRPPALPALFRDLQVARALAQQARAGSCEAMLARSAQETLLSCLTAFTAELTAQGLPVPRTVNAEARLYENMLDVHQA